MRTLIVEADGGSRGNPGVAAGGAVVIDGLSGEVLAEVAVFIGVATNNVAEYSGLVAGLRRARQIDDSASIHVKMDSKLVVEQMAGRWKIKHPDMRELALEANSVIAGVAVTWEWIAREFNSRADAVANRSMDRRESIG